jgi:hypothetical protein
MSLLVVSAQADATGLGEGAWIDAQPAGDFWAHFRQGKSASAAAQVDAMADYFAQEASLDTVRELRSFFRARTRAQAAEQVVKAGGKGLWIDAIGDRLGIVFVSTNVPASALCVKSKGSTGASTNHHVPRIHHASSFEESPFERIGDRLMNRDQLESWFPKDEEIAQVLENGTPMPPYATRTTQTYTNASRIMELLYKKAVKAHANVGSSTVLFNFIENKLHSRGYGQ